VADEIEKPAPGELAATRGRARALQQSTFSNSLSGLNFGTYSSLAGSSPMMERHPSYTMALTPATVPAARTPHLWCEDGKSLYDAMGGVSRCWMPEAR